MPVYQLNERVRVLVGPPDPIAWDIRGRPGTVTQVWDGVFASAGDAAGNMYEVRLDGVPYAEETTRMLPGTCLEPA
ncbi:MAG: hypothetical protein NTZ05_21790 [Chloroflexi bacterium]|nr:hypothetical protein [Chloroflexota bacterium]